MLTYFLELRIVRVEAFGEVVVVVVEGLLKNKVLFY